ncbi:MAG: DUF4129 domain-containing protein [Terracidiphilus sp.]
MRARRSWVRWLATTALAAWFAAAFAGATAFAVSPLPSSAPAPPPGRWRDATLDDYRKHLADLIPLVESCGKARDLKNCDPLLVGPDDRVPLAEGANAERRLVRFGWLRVLFSRAEEPDEPATNSGGAQKSGTDQANTQAAQPTTTQLLQAAANRLAYDLAQASRAVPTEAANTQERAIMQEVLAGRDFRGLEQPSARDTVMEKVGAWLNHLIESVTRLRARSAWIGRLLVWGFVLALCVGLVVFLLQLERRWRVRLVPEGREAASSAVSARNWQLWLDDARQAAAAGNWREAIHFMYWAAISRLESRRLWPADRARTPREYLALVAPEDPRRTGLAALTGSFERVWYGGRAAVESDYRRAEEIAASLIEGGAA